jgi:hypothetical protein
MSSMVEADKDHVLLTNPKWTHAQTTAQTTAMSRIWHIRVSTGIIGPTSPVLSPSNNALTIYLNNVEMSRSDGSF